MSIKTITLIISCYIILLIKSSFPQDIGRGSNTLLTNNGIINDSTAEAATICMKNNNLAGVSGLAGSKLNGVNGLARVNDLAGINGITGLAPAIERGINSGIPSSSYSPFGGPFLVTSASPIPSSGLSVFADGLLIDGNLAVTGSLPLLAAVTLEGTMPATGHASTTYSCGNGNVGIISKEITTGSNVGTNKAFADSPVGYGLNGFTGGLRLGLNSNYPLNTGNVIAAAI